MNRRAFLLRAATSGAALCVSGRGVHAHEPRAPELRVVLLLGEHATPAAASARRGAELAVLEVRRAAELLRGNVSFVALHGERVSVSEHDKPAHAYVRAFDVTGATANENAPLLLDLFASSCSGALRLDPPAAIYASARRAAGDDVRVVRWHDSLTRYGAAQLNDRYRALQQQPMDAAAWAGWFAVKSLWDAAARVRAVSAAALRDYMLSERGVFDGHKGEPLRFGADGVLLQPLYALRTAGEPQAISMHTLIAAAQSTCVI